MVVGVLVFVPATPLDIKCICTYSDEMQKAFENLEGLCVGQGLRRAARQVTRRYDAVLKPVGLSLSQFSILAAVGAASPVSLGPLAAHLGMDRTTLTRDLKPLERRGLLTSLTHSTDRRQRPLALTDAGETLLRAALPLWANAQRDSLERLGSATWSDLRRLIHTL